ncbi:MAG: hypothetical protein LAT84_13630 [Balneolia bacterium]|nr:hypothetical protein [Balneolia bacterium]
MMVKKTFIGLIILVISGIEVAHAQDFTYGGYVQALPLRISAELPEPFGEEVFWEYRLQSRLELRWLATDNLEFNAQGRARLFAGDLVQDIPGYASVIDTDDGYVNLSWMAVETDDVLLHLIPDRLYADWTAGDWNIRAGRQRVNWGINTITNPNDLFNIYSIYEFDYPERPGTDAIRVRYYLDWASRIEFAAAPSRHGIRQSVYAGMYGFNTRGYDVQLITGYYQNRFALGGGWAGSISDTGFKGEVMGFYDAETPESGDREASVVAAVSADHMLDSGLFVITEGLYNSRGGLEEFGLLGQPLSADNPSISTWQLSGIFQYQFTPLFNGSLSAIWYPDENGMFLSPSVDYSLTQNTDAMLLAQFFLGADDSPLSNAGNVIALSVKWNF